VLIVAETAYRSPPPSRTTVPAWTTLRSTVAVSVRTPSLIVYVKESLPR
jgi:hypothetical protein